MKCLALFAVAALVISCQSESHTPPPTPSTSLASIHVDVPGPISEILPELIPTKQSVSSLEASKIELESGVVITIPEHSFVYENGTPVTEHVDLIIEDMTSLGAILQSGIRMDAKMPNGEYGAFQTAGMISIKPVQNVKIAPGKTINISFPTKNMDEDFALWKLDEASNEWVQLDDALPVSKPATQVRATSMAPASGIVNTRSINLIEDDEGNQVINFSDQEKYIEELLEKRRGWKPVKAVPFNRSAPYQFPIAFSSRWFKPTPELSNVSPLYLMSVDSASNWSLGHMSIRSAKMHRGVGDYYIVSAPEKKSDTTLYAKVRWSYTREQARNRAAAYAAYAITMHRSDSTMLKLVDHILAEIENLEFRDEEYLALRKQCENYISTTPTIEQPERETYLLHLIIFRASYKDVVDDRIMNEVNQKIMSATAQNGSSRNIDISTFGVYNCDKFYSEPTLRFALNFNTGTGSKFLRLKLVDIESRAIIDLSYNFGQPGNTYSLSLETEFVIIGTDDVNTYLGKVNTANLSTSRPNEVLMVNLENEAELQKVLADLG
ncbi:MAG: hypothetical protein HWE14_14815 [Flavobacteriia bacterium]|nr:hypothetical protein [Flavobacteriia bacterium]